MDSSTPFQGLQTNVQKALVGSTRTTNSLVAEDLSFCRSFDPSLGPQIDQQNARLLAVAERLIHNATENTEVVAPKFHDADDVVENKWRGVVDVIDSLLERADTSLDEFSGAVKRISPKDDQSPVPINKPSKTKNLYRNANIVKPQKFFEQQPQNYEKGPWKPFLSSKPNAIKPLEESFEIFKNEDGFEQYRHPYEHEIKESNYPASAYTKAEPIEPQAWEGTSATFVDTREQLAAMLAELKTAKEIAVDLEHHDSRTYIGIVSLMQISTRNKDWIVDTLQPWRRQLECLNEVFTDPNIIKVLHGAFMDAVWLQRDLGVYLVGLFDTYHAARTLGYKGGSLAFLLQKFVNFEAQKQYQLADWRIRPLPEDLIDYARSDTHFLLYIYDMMRNDLVDRSDFSDPDNDKIKTVLEKSKHVALQRYESPSYDEESGKGTAGWLRLVAKSSQPFTKQQFSVLRAVHKWRDDVAREEDESPVYIMGNHAIFNLAREMPIAKHMLLQVVSPVSHMLRARANEVVQVVIKAKKHGEKGPELNEVLDRYMPRRINGLPSLTSQPAVQPASTAGALTEPPSTLSVSAPKTDKSRFWGSSILSGLLGQQRQMSTLSLALPLPPLTAEVFSDPSDSANVGQEPRPEHSYVKKSERPKEDDNDGVFTIKQLGQDKKRKADAMSADKIGNNRDVLTFDQAFEDSVTAEKSQQRADKAAKQEETKADKKTRRRSKKQKKAAKIVHPDADDSVPQGLEYGDEGADEPEMQPFDYDTVPNLMNVPRGPPKGKEKRVNPFARAMDTRAGLPKVKREAPGKSATFKK